MREKEHRFSLRIPKSLNDKIDKAMIEYLKNQHINYSKNNFIIDILQLYLDQKA